MAPPLDAYLKGLAAGVSLAFALLLLRGARRSRASAYLAAFLLLIGANQATEVVRIFATDAAAQALLMRLAAVFAATDPLLLAAFASVYPTTRSRLRDARALGAIAGGSVLLAAGAMLP